MRAKPKAADVYAWREANECGIEEAKRDVMAEWRRSCLYDIRLQASELYTVEACRDVIVDLLDLLMDER